LATNAIDTANLVDIIENDKTPAGRNAAGTNHHIAFRVKDDQVLMEYRDKVLSAGLSITRRLTGIISIRYISVNREAFYLK
jgi:glyoxalase family protein